MDYQCTSINDDYRPYDLTKKLIAHRSIHLYNRETESCKRTFTHTHTCKETAPEAAKGPDNKRQGRC